MAQSQTKISQLPEANDLDDSSLIAVVVDGTTYKGTVADLRAALTRGTFEALVTYALKLQNANGTDALTINSPAANFTDITSHGALLRFINSIIAVYATFISANQANMTTYAPSLVPLTVRGVAGQSANLHEWRDGNDVLRAYIAPDGTFHTA